MKQAKNIRDTLRLALETSGKTVYQLSKESGVDQATIGRFIKGERDVRMETGGKLAAVVGLALRRT